jgi:L-aminopeptidase/D-esterase-like protein
VSEPLPPPEGFAIGHWTDAEGETGCTVLIAPEGARGGVDVRGGGTGTREIDAVGPMTGTVEVTAVMLSGGSAYGLGAADGAMRWLERHGHGYRTPGGLVPIVPAAVIYDLATGDPSARPDAAAGEAACEAAVPGVPERGLVGAGAGAAVGKVLGRERVTRTGIGYAAARTGFGHTVAAIAVANSFGDVLAEDGSILAGARGEDGSFVPTALTLAAMEGMPEWTRFEEGNTTLACVMTDASLTKPACTRVARMASAGIARAVDPVFSDFDGDVVFCLAGGDPPGDPDRFAAIAVGTVAAHVTAAAIRDSVE